MSRKLYFQIWHTLVHKIGYVIGIFCIIYTYEESLLWKPLVGNEPYAFNKPMIALYYKTVWMCAWIFHYNQYIKFMIWAISYPTRRYYIKLRTDNKHTKTDIQKAACPLVSPFVEQITIPLHQIFIWIKYNTWLILILDKLSKWFWPLPRDPGQGLGIN